MIASDRLVLALEPECASILCKNIAPEKLLHGKCLTFSEKGTQYVVADIGGTLQLMFGIVSYYFKACLFIRKTINGEVF